MTDYAANTIRAETREPVLVKTEDLRSNPLCSYISRLSRNENLRRDEAVDLFGSLVSESATDAQVAAVLVALAMKGETAYELAGMATAMRSHAVRIESSHSTFIDTAGTGSSGAKTFNISTAAAFVVAGAGLPVAKHGGRAATSRSGSADALTSLGVGINARPEISEDCLNEIGICFMFAPLYHGAAARVAAIRRQVGIPTTFNLLGPLTNPAKAPFQLIGVWRESLIKPMAEALLELGTKRAWVVHGCDGLDEVTIAGPTMVGEVFEGTVREFKITPEEFGVATVSMNGLPCGSSEVSARLIREVLAGERRDEAREVVVINAAAALLLGGAASNLKEAALMARESIDSGMARAKLTALIRMTNE